MPFVNEFTAVVERDQRWFVAYCVEIWESTPAQTDKVSPRLRHYRASKRRFR